MTLTKRAFLASGAAATAGTVLMPRKLWAQSDVSIGTKTITTLSDGALNLPAEFIFGPMPQDELAGVLAPFDMRPDEAISSPCNITLIRDGERLILVDCGAGFAFQASAGQLPDTLAAAGIDPGDITHVVITHGHPDHVWGLLDDFDELAFYNAEHMMGAGEFAYWMDDTTVDSIGEARTSFAVGAKRRLEAVADAITLFDDGQEVLPGMIAQLTPGHTPGHMAFAVADGNDSVMILGDAIGNSHVAFARPEWLSGSDQDMAMGAQTRARLLDQVASDGMRVVGFHLPQGGIGSVARDGAGYRFVTEG